MLSTRLIQLLFNFARKSKPIPSAPIINTQSIIQQIQKSQQSPNMFKKVINLQQSKQEQITYQNNESYLAYEQSVKLKIKQQIAKQLKFNPSFQGQDPTPSKLVNRPSKGVVWGLGGQLILANKKVQLQGLKDDIDQIIQFLQLNQVKNIYLHDFHKSNPQRPQTNKRRYHIIGSCFSARHCWKISTELKNAFNLHSGKSKLRRGRKYDPIFATRTGGKDQEFCMVEYKDFSISLMTEEQRQAMDLEYKWNNQVPEETLDKYMKAKLDRKGRKNQFEDL